ncbi:MAG: hypothetical protein H6797_05910 [Candidatus Nomurabacteria bacterium]|nr:MAG: hypothetical protein H6797_05910 [Candidatus Nomurabacteria bacterium]
MSRHNQEPKNKDKKLNWKKVTAVTAIGGAAVLGVGACSTENSNSNSSPAISNSSEAPHMYGDTNGDSTFSQDELHAMSPSDVANIAPSLLANAYASDFEKYRQDTLNILVDKNLLYGQEKDILSAPSGPKVNYTDQQVINEVTLDVADSSMQPDPTDGQRMLALPYNKDAGGFTDAQNFIKPGAGVNLNAYIQTDDPIPRPQGEFNGVDLSDYAQARVIRQRKLPNNPQDAIFDEISLYGLIKDKSGQNEEWQLVQRWLATDSGVNLAVDKLTAPGNW